MMVGKLLSFWDGIFSGAMLNFQGVFSISTIPCRSGGWFFWWNKSLWARNLEKKTIELDGGFFQGSFLMGLRKSQTESNRNDEPKSSFSIKTYDCIILCIMTSLDLLKMFGKSTNHSPKWWFNGGLPWKIQQITLNISKYIYICIYHFRLAMSTNIIVSSRKWTKWIVFTPTKPFSFQIPAKSSHFSGGFDSRKNKKHH